MSSSGWLLLGLIVIALAGGATLYLRRADNTRKKARLEAYVAVPSKKHWGKQLTLPAHGPVCLAAKGLANQCFKFDEAPRLPLTECTCKFDCRCSYKLLEERRSGIERRKGCDRRLAVRYDPDNPPRRSGCDRRKDKNSLFDNYVI